jgi:hypothetical protein
MIINARNKRPKITFGLGKTELIVALGDTVKVFQHSIYLDADFDTALDISAEGLGHRRLSNYTFLLSTEAVGTYEFRAYVEDKGTALKGVSNKLTLIVE